MAFNSNTPRMEFTATAGQTEFVFNFKVFNTSDIAVYQTPTGQAPDDATDILIETTHYTVVIDGDNGGTVTLVSGATLNDSVTLLRDLPFTRETDYQTGGDLLEATLDEDQDYQTYLSQQLESSKGQFINLPASVQGVSASLPSPIADSYFKWNAAGDGIENDTTIPTNVALAVDSAAAALVSENAAATDLVLTNADVVTTGNNVTAAQLLEWEAEAERLTANSYATEAEDVFVNTYSSDGDGTFTATPSTEYSALHWAAKASVGTAAIDVSITDVGGYYTGTEAETALQEVGLNSSLRRSSIPMSKVLSGILSLSNTVKTLGFDGITYTGNGTSQDIVTGISSVDFTVASNGSGYWLDRTVNQVKNDAGAVVASGECKVNTSKVHIKSRSTAYSNYIYDGFRGINTYVRTDATAVETGEANTMTSFNSNGVTVGSNIAHNANLATYIAYQTLYTHIKWGVTSHGKFQIEAYNPVTNEGMIYYIGSGVAGHQISHSMGVEIDYLDIKNLSVTTSWSSQIQENKHLRLNATLAETPTTSRISVIGPSHITTGDVSAGYEEVNTLNSEHILYYKCKSETFTIGTYTGTGSAGNFVETKDVNGVARKPRRVIIKAISIALNWVVYDSERGGANIIYLSSSGTEQQNTAYEINFLQNGIILLNDASISWDNNRHGVKYLYLVEFDTDNTGTTGSYFDMATDTTNLQIADGLVSISSGYDSQGAINKVISKTGTIIPNGGWI